MYQKSAVAQNLCKVIFSQNPYWHSAIIIWKRLASILLFVFYGYKMFECFNFDLESSLFFKYYAFLTIMNT